MCIRDSSSSQQPGALAERCLPQHIDVQLACGEKWTTHVSRAGGGWRWQTGAGRPRLKGPVKDS
eukprot:6181293-Prorocentrum_lima.AAC.1